jgi:hypothetical protein
MFNNLRKVELMSFGVPEEWVDDVRAANEDTLFNVISHLPQETLLQLAVGEKPEPPKPEPVEAEPFAHPDALRRFRVLGDVEALRRALEEPWEKWAVSLHPSQAALVARNFSGPARVSGSAGTGKTVVALHRAAHMARQNATCRVPPDNLLGCIGARPSDLYADAFGPVRLVLPKTVRGLIADRAKQMGLRFSLPFLIGEWFDLIEPWLVQSKQDYIKMTRLGRKTRLSVSQRETLWPLFQDVHEVIAARGETTNARMFGRVTEAIASATKPPYDFAVIDEAQDLAVAEGRFLAAFGGGRPNALFFAGDLGQRIFQTPFSWKSLGLDIRGRSYTLRVNYRTSHQIRTQADLCYR